jgi:peptidyl-prolyl cis-trans isomerase C
MSSRTAPLLLSDLSKPMIRRHSAQASSASSLSPLRCLRGWMFTGAALLLVACGDPQVVAEVGKQKVTRAQVAAYVDAQSARARPSPQEALDALVSRSLLAEQARREGLTDDEAVKARVAAAEREVLAQALLDKRLASEVTESALRKRYEASRDALSRRQVHVRQLFVKVAGSDEAARNQAWSRMNALQARLAGGEDFEKVAREASEDPVSAARGGDLGTVQEGQVDKSFFDEAVKLGRAERSRPFASLYGLHLVEAVEGARTVVPTFEESRGRLEAQARQDAQARLARELRETITVTTHPERLGVDGGLQP